ncbi:hypothetical protein HD806DRAFT_537749 [Xylariaceae sp. AK1471]|nr:hypothetical protein HD806DRAFT_537749 [Xylariaceae sp. AK1471]
MNTHQYHLSRSTNKDSNETTNKNGIGGGLSRSLHLRGCPVKYKLRHHSDTVGSLDRIFDTNQNSDKLSAVPLAIHPSLNWDENNFVQNTHGIAETRDGFFDAVFLPPEDIDIQNLMKHAKETLPFAFREKDPLSLTQFFPRQCRKAWSVICRLTTTRSGIKLLKSFLAFYITYIVCLIPGVRKKFGRYAYIMVISTIVNHPGRTLGAQVDGTLLTTIGTATGLGWGAFGLWVSTTTATARVGFGGILALFLFLNIFAIACLRSYYIRAYQLVLCAGISISYTCLADVLGTRVSWDKVLAYLIPWLIGQAISLFVCCVVAPDAGSRPFATGIHQIFVIMLDGIPPVIDPVGTRRRLTQAFVGMSQLYRDLVLDFSITTLNPRDALMLRNSIQAVLRTLLSLRTETTLFEPLTGRMSGQNDSSRQELPNFIIEMDKRPRVLGQTEEQDIVKFVTEGLAISTKDLVESMKLALKSCDAVLVDTSGHRRHLGPPSNISSDVSSALVSLRKHIAAFKNQQERVLFSDKLPQTYSKFPEVVKVFAFCLLVHQAARSIESLTTQVNELQQKWPKYPHFHLPSYPFWKAIHRANAQVRHDRGDVTAGSYFKSFSDIAKIIRRLQSRDFHPVPQIGIPGDKGHDTAQATMTADDLSNDSSSQKNPLRHWAWILLHRLQGFETRFGLKTALVTSLLAIPAYLTDTRLWWDDYEAWWAVALGWLIMGPRAGGNVPDLFTRVTCAALGSLWGCLAYEAGKGNPYVMAMFAAIFMLPMMYRYTQSTHPRSGIIGCISFIVVSLREIGEAGKQSITRIAATRGFPIVVGVVASVIVNWILWPFVARHELRKGMASMMFCCSIVYSNVVSKYVYYDEGHAPTDEDIEASEILEGRLREGFGLTRHEIRLRASFDPLPYSALIDACEHFFEHVVTLRQSSLFYHPQFIRDDSEAAIDLLRCKRDAIATILTNLYILSGALRASRQVPRYLPNAAVARKRLLDRMFQLEKEHAANGKHSSEEERQEMKLGQIYSYSYNESLTGCVEQLRQLEKYTKLIVGLTVALT